jgi:hypothetical protein
MPRAFVSEMMATILSYHESSAYETAQKVYDTVRVRFLTVILPDVCLGTASGLVTTAINHRRRKISKDEANVI